MLHLRICISEVIFLTKTFWLFQDSQIVCVRLLIFTGQNTNTEFNCVVLGSVFTALIAAYLRVCTISQSFLDIYGWIWL